MKLYHFNHNGYGEEFYVMAENRVEAHKSLLRHLQNKIDDPNNKVYKDMYEDDLEMWKNVNPLIPDSFPGTFTLDEHEVGDVIQSEIA